MCEFLGKSMFPLPRLEPKYGIVYGVRSCINQFSRKQSKFLTSWGEIHIREKLYARTQ